MSTISNIKQQTAKKKNSIDIAKIYKSLQSFDQFRIGYSIGGAVMFPAGVILISIFFCRCTLYPC